MRTSPKPIEVHSPMTLAAFMRWKAPSSCSWQLSDFREHCIDAGTARTRRPLLDWLRDFKALTRDDAELFDTDGGGQFTLR